MIRTEGTLRWLVVGVAVELTALAYTVVTLVRSNAATPQMWIEGAISALAVAAALCMRRSVRPEAVNQGVIVGVLWMSMVLFGSATSIVSWAEVACWAFALAGPVWICASASQCPSWRSGLVWGVSSGLASGLATAPAVLLIAHVGVAVLQSDLNVDLLRNALLVSTSLLLAGPLMGLAGGAFGSLAAAMLQKRAVPSTS